MVGSKRGKNSIESSILGNSSAQSRPCLKSSCRPRSKSSYCCAVFPSGRVTMRPVVPCSSIVDQLSAVLEVVFKPTISSDLPTISIKQLGGDILPALPLSPLLLSFLARQQQGTAIANLESSRLPSLQQVLPFEPND